MKTDEELMLASRAGSNEAFAELFARYRQPMWGFFRRRLASAARAEELAQDVFVAVLKAAARYEASAPFRAYVFGIAFRLLAADRRRGTGRLAAPLATDLPGPNRAPETGLWVRQALGRLEDTDREIVMLREFEQLKYAEIASLLNVPVNTVRSRLFRARMELRRLLAPDGAKGSINDDTPDTRDADGVERRRAFGR